MGWQKLLLADVCICLCIVIKGLKKLKARYQYIQDSSCFYFESPFLTWGFHHKHQRPAVTPLCTPEVHPQSGSTEWMYFWSGCTSDPHSFMMPVNQHSCSKVEKIKIIWSEVKWEQRSCLDVCPRWFNSSVFQDVRLFIHQYSLLSPSGF